MDSANRIRVFVDKYLCFPSLLPEYVSASPPPRRFRLRDIERQYIPTPTAAAAANDLKTTFGLAFGAAIAIFTLLNSTATKASPHSLYLLIVAVMVAFSASLIGISIPRIARVMESVAVVSIAVTFYMFVSLLLPEETRWVILLIAVVVLLLYLLLYLGPSIRNVYHRVGPNLEEGHPDMIKYL